MYLNWVDSTLSLEKKIEYGSQIKKHNASLTNISKLNCALNPTNLNKNISSNRKIRPFSHKTVSDIRQSSSSNSIKIADNQTQNTHDNYDET